ncbi:MAG: hypothetical protein HC875_13900 [Anaerolineales bacterium]|nr:hypothetical protein [Anaerolineales bacterium]
MAAVWGLDANETRATLKQLLRFALIERIDRTYRIHPLLHDYARQKLAALPAQETGYQRRHAVWYVRYALYHPALLPENSEAAPPLESAWADSVAGVRWATASAPRLAAQAVLLAHTERPALLEEIGLPLIEAVETYLNEVSSGVEQALLTEVLGDLYLLHQNIPAGLARFEEAVKLWQTVENGLASSQAQLRLAGAYLLAQAQPAAAQAARQARLILEASLPLSAQDMAQADRLFYWFNLVYNTLVRWESLPEEDVAALARCAEAMDHPAFQARGLSIYRLWCTTRAVARSEAIRQRGRKLAVQAYYLWRAAGRPDRADDVVSFGKYWLTNRYSRRTARRYARRRANTTPPISPAQVRLIKNEGMRWWLNAATEQRVGWLSWMLPRYLAADNRPRHPVTGQYLPVLKPGDRAYGWVDDIINVGSLGAVGRRLMLGSQPPPDHFLDGHEWRAFTGQRVLPLSHESAKALVKQYLQNLEVEASTG